ncbi:hypothetical protein [Calidithermus terrae]|uniref:hypothetical protein n=1 Tax=Calidithermus terrae TaxID=1408545 RepID=UPI000E65DC4D|nr:hypothetical protein [Calidithermus terrae]
MQRRGAFRLELPASAPPREEALQGLPSLKAWKGFYEVGFLSGSAMPELTLRCGDGEAVAVRLEQPFNALAVAGDPASPGGLRVVQYSTNPN